MKFDDVGGGGHRGRVHSINSPDQAREQFDSSVLLNNNKRLTEPLLIKQSKATDMKGLVTCVTVKTLAGLCREGKLYSS